MVFEYALPERELLPAEQTWSNIMDPKATSQLLEEQLWPCGEMQWPE